MCPTSMTDVAVIGAGPAGLAVGAALRRVGADFDILERSFHVGSSWRAHYERIRLHTIKQLSSLPYCPFPASYPRYVPRALMIEYLERYAGMFDLRPRFGESVLSVKPDGLAWRVESTSGVLYASHVVIATGLNGEPTTPPLDGIETFPGQVLHSSAYVNSTPFAGQSVLVVGMGNTGAEIALDLCLGGASTSISVRGGVHVAPGISSGCQSNSLRWGQPGYCRTGSTTRFFRRCWIGRWVTPEGMAYDAPKKASSIRSRARVASLSSTSEPSEKLLKGRSK